MCKPQVNDEIKKIIEEEVVKRDPIVLTDKVEVTEARTVVGSRYGGGSSVVGASSAARSRPSSGSQFTVVGAGFRRKRSPGAERFLRLVL